MSREIKFRIWHTSINRMAVSEDVMNYEAQQFKEVITQEWDDEVLMQFTGQKDKNGVELYEGDVVDNANHERLGVVTYQPDYMMFLFSPRGVVEPGVEASRITSNADKKYFHDGQCDWLEVVGNIWESPELLEVTA